MLTMKRIQLLPILIILMKVCSLNGQGNGAGQCLLNNTLDKWTGEMIFSHTCDPQARPYYTFKIPTPQNITDGYNVTFTFINFTAKQEQKDCQSKQFENVDIMYTYGSSEIVCRKKEERFNIIVKVDPHFELIVNYSQPSSPGAKDFVIRYIVPDNPCKSCNEQCLEQDCVKRSSCTSLQDSYRCPCLPNPCHNDGTCINVSDNNQGYNCSCIPPYTGRHCENEDDSFCKRDSSATIYWKDTKMGQVDNESCPPGANGTAKRECLDVDNKPVWSHPDLSECVSPIFSEISNHAIRLSEAKYVTRGAILNITENLTNAIEQRGEKRIYAGDMAAATQTVETVAAALAKIQIEDDTGGLIHVAKGCGNVISSILDPTTSDVWSFSHKGYLENKVTSILGSLQVISGHIANKTSEQAQRNVKSGGESYNITTANIDYSIHVLDRTTNFTAFRNKADGQQVSLSLPKEVFDISVIKTSDPYIHLYSARFKSVATLVNKTNEKIQGIPSQNMTKVINSDILASTILNVPESEFQRLTEPVKLTFLLQDPELSANLQASCVFMNMSNMSAEADEERWLKKGCYKSDIESNATHTVCYCSHLTNFAVLMDIYEVEESIDGFHSEVLTYISYGGGALSILGCLVTVIVFEFFRLKTERVRIHEQLALTIILVQIFFLVGIDRTENKHVCMAMAICLHYFLVAMFAWMLVEGAHLYLLLVKVFQSRSYMKIYVAVGWGIPAIIVAISAGLFHNEYGSGTICWLSTKILLVAFVPPVVLVIVINTIVLFVVMRIMLKSISKGSRASSEERSSVKTGLKAAAVLLPLLGLTWTFGFLSFTSRETLIFTYMFTVFNSLQGVFFFVFHCLLSVDVQSAYARHSRRQSQRRMTESSLSKRGTTKKGSDLDSSAFDSSYSRSSTAMTSASSSLERKKSNKKSEQSFHGYNEAYDDDHFYRSISVSSNKSNTGKPNILHNNVNNKGTVDRYSENGRHYDNRILNNNVPRSRSSRSGSESSNDFVLYYGKNNFGNINYDIDKNELLFKSP